MSAVSQADDLTVDLSFFHELPAQLQAIGTAVVNAAAVQGRTEAVKLMRESVNLPETYIRDKLRIVKATRGGNPEAVIRAERRPVLLSRFASRQLVRAAKRAKGDPLRGIAKGRKQAGISVKVKRSGGRAKMPGAFFIPIRANKVEGGNGMALAVRTGTGRDDYEIKYGPSVDQMFQSVRDQVGPELLDQMLDAFLARLEKLA